MEIMKKILFASVTILVMLWMGCKSSDLPAVLLNDPEKVEVLENIQIQFNQAMVNDSMLQRWDSTAYIAFKPAVRGMFRWEAADLLVFSPAEPFLPATQYTATVEPDAFKSLSDIPVSKQSFSFQTPLLEVVSAYVKWNKDVPHSAQLRATMELRFNFPVNPADLKGNLAIKSKDQALAYDIATVGETKVVEAILKDVPVDEKDLVLDIQISGQMLPVGGSVKSKNDFNVKTTLFSPLNFSVLNVESEHMGNQGRVTITTSQPIVANGLKEKIEITPKVNFSVNVLDGGFEIVSNDFSASEVYSLTIKSGVKGELGGILKQDIFQEFEFGTLAPNIEFADRSAIYLGKGGQRNIAIQISGMSEVKLTVYKIYENNILAAHKYHYDPGEDWYSMYDIQFGDVVYEANINVMQLPLEGRNRILHFDFKDKIADHQGVYYVSVRSPDDYWISDQRLISFSNIGLIAKHSDRKITAFANEISTAESIHQLNVLVYGKNNQLLGKAVTNEKGVAEIDLPKSMAPGFEPVMIVAKSENDFNYLLLPKTTVNTHRFEVGGKHINASGLDVYMYGPRDIYRPGETIYYTGIIRTPDWKIPDNPLYILKWRYPNGKEISTLRKNINKEGSFEGSYAIPQSAITGTYTLEVYTPTEVLLTSQPYHIEEFMPDRIKLLMPSLKNLVKIGETVNLGVVANNLFGTPAANRNFEIETQLKFKQFYSKKYAQYNYSLKNTAIKVQSFFEEGKTSQEGSFGTVFKADNMYSNNGLLEVNSYVTVFDETGRPVSRSAKFDLLTQPYFAGIGGYNYNYFPLNQSVSFPLIAVTSDDQIASQATLKVEVIKFDYKNILRRSGEFYRYQSQETSTILETKTIKVQGSPVNYTFKPLTPGRYSIRVYTESSNAYVENTFYSYGSWGGARNDFEVNKEGQIDIELDKASYKVGEKVKALFKAPFDGKLLVTVETNQLIHYEYLNVKDLSATTDLPINASYLPNAYITATLIKPHDLSDLPLTTAVGFKNVTVEDDSRKINVKLTAAAQSRSKQTQRIVVQAAPNAAVTLAVVDEGVNQITDFKAPNPYNYFYAKRALTTGSFNLYPFLFPEKQSILSSTGAGDDMMAKRVNTMPAKRVEIVSYWSGIQTANASGEAVFNVPVPAFSGSLQVMAVAYKGNQFGAASQDMKVVDPLIISAALPRFMSPKDTVQMPVTITNTTQQAIQATADLKLSEGVQLKGNRQTSVNIPAGKESIVLYELIAPEKIGVSNLTVQVKGAGETFENSVEWSVRPVAPLQKRSGSGSMVSGNTNININTTGFIPQTADYQLIVSALPAVSMGKQLDYLLNYPYGCTEQTISAAFPQLYYRELIHFYQRPGNTNVALINIDQAMKTIQKRQIYNGGVLLWDYAGSYNVSAHWFSSVYAAHFMLEAQKAGYEIDRKTLSGLLNFIEGQLKSGKKIDYRFNNGSVKQIAPKEVAYSLYVLALAKQPNRSLMNYYAEQMNILSLDAKYLLSAAYALVGDDKAFNKLLPQSFSGEVADIATGGSFYSPIRDEAIALNALLDVRPDHAQVPVMAAHVSESLSKRRWFTTQEAVFSVLAIGKMAQQANQNNLTADILVEGKKVAQTKGNTIQLSKKDLNGTQIQAQVQGTGKLYYSWVSEGIDSDGKYEEVDNYIKVRRKFYNRNGALNTSMKFNQNDLIIVEIRVEKSYSDYIENVVVTDMLPAGFEIENTRLESMPAMNWIKSRDRALSEDFRDDRVNLFVDLYKQQQTYYYMVRAVSPGVYQLGPVSADAMYNGEMHSYNGGGTVTIVP